MLEFSGNSDDTNNHDNQNRPVRHKFMHAAWDTNVDAFCRLILEEDFWIFGANHLADNNFLLITPDRFITFRFQLSREFHFASVTILTKANAISPFLIDLSTFTKRSHLRQNLILVNSVIPARHPAFLPFLPVHRRYRLINSVF